MNDESNHRWEAIVSGIVHPTGPAGEGAPFGFPTRVVGLWRAARRDEALRRWSLWSLRAALCSVGICGWVAVLGAMKNDPPLLLDPPSAEFITPPLTTP